MEKENLVSVVVPTYNRKNTLKRCIDSVLNQTYRNFEIIIVDDCSTDGTYEFVEAEYGNIKDIDIIYVINDTNLGTAPSRNVGASYANGEYIAFHDSDDAWMPEKLEKQMECFKTFKNDPTVGGVYCEFLMGGLGNIIYPPKNVDMSYKTGNVFHTLLFNALATTMTIVVKKSVYTEIGGFNEQIKSLIDYEFTLRLAEKYKLILVDEVLAVSYDSENSVGKRNKDKIVTQCYIMERYKNELARLGLKKEKFEGVYRDACRWHCEDFFLQYLSECSEDKDYLAYAQKKQAQKQPTGSGE
jgi:glycosyltransferase involved in cell wall biosynthesis